MINYMIFKIFRCYYVVLFVEGIDEKGGCG
jgi:hypothetical protein